MAGRITRKKVDDIWTSGFCREAVEHARKTEDTLQGAEARVAFLQAHIRSTENPDGCLDCYFANVLKNAEAEVASEIGPQALGAFFRGENVLERPGYSEDMVRRALDRIAAHGLMTENFKAWMERAAKRKRYKPHKR